MRKSIPGPAAIAALLVALVAGHDIAHAAPNDCLSAPNGAAPKGQHWYYHLDRANNRKCWYLRDIGAAAATPSAAPSQQADNPAPAQPDRGAATPTVNSAATMQPVQHPALSQPAADPAPSAAATTVQTATPAPAPSAAAPHAATVWTDPTSAAASDVEAAAAAAPGQTQPVATDQPVRQAPAKKRAAAPRETQAAAAAPASDTASATPFAQNVLVILLAALLAGAVFAVFAILRRRKPVKIRAAGSGPRFGSRRERDEGHWLKWPRRSNDAQRAAPIQSSLIPQQVSMTRQSASRR